MNRNIHLIAEVAGYRRKLLLHSGHLLQGAYRVKHNGILFNCRRTYRHDDVMQVIYTIKNSQLIVIFPVLQTKYGTALLQGMRTGGYIQHDRNLALLSYFPEPFNSFITLGGMGIIISFGGKQLPAAHGVYPLRDDRLPPGLLRDTKEGIRHTFLPVGRSSHNPRNTGG